MKLRFAVFSAGLALGALWLVGPSLSARAAAPAKGPLDRATFAGGCFWCMEALFDKVPGVVSTNSSYAGGRTRYPRPTSRSRRAARGTPRPSRSPTTERGVAHRLTGADIRVVAPFNAQVNRLTERLAPLGVPAGTVDKFQGQTAAVVIYSMTTSRPEDAPRGLEFLFSLNRLNVATSRVRCAVFVVCSPRVLSPECHTLRQMQLANALCRYFEMSQ